jgi:hypothetical protein
MGRAEAGKQGGLILSVRIALHVSLRNSPRILAGISACGSVKATASQPAPFKHSPGVPETLISITLERQLSENKRRIMNVIVPSEGVIISPE